MKLSLTPRRPILAGQVTLGIEWSWRIEKQRSILAGSWSDERRWPGAFAALTGAKVVSLDFPGRIPEIDVGLDNGMHLVSAMTAEGQPAWSLGVRKPALGYLGVAGGRLAVEAAAEPLEVLAPGSRDHE